MEFLTLKFLTGCAINRDMFYLSSTLDELEATEDILHIVDRGAFGRIDHGRICDP
ncbi:hypothetical protein BVI434_1040004 [Burkholderia vietnamiensis]|nr:hypothetical protein BVI434_1040004 [Burkholderia vietnamiensis]